MCRGKNRDESFSAILLFAFVPVRNRSHEVARVLLV
jgi:hypothetical protein